MREIINLVGERFGKLMVINRDTAVTNKEARWECKCDCGKTSIVSSYSLRNGRTTSCGCINNGEYLKRITLYGKSITTEYNIWRSMIARCNNKNDAAYNNYGGRGITVCQRWTDSFDNFITDMGRRPKNMTIERVENDLGYFKENCKWATRKEQSLNRRSTIWLEHDGVRLSKTDWAKKLNTTLNGINYRFGLGESFSEIVNHFSIPTTKT